MSHLVLVEMFYCILQIGGGGMILFLNCISGFIVFPEKDLGKGARETLTVQISVIHLYTTEHVHIYYGQTLC